MARVQDRLRQLQRQLEASENGIVDATRALVSAQDDVKRLTSRRELLHDVRNEVSASRALIEGQRQAVRKDADAGARAHRDLTRRFDEGLGRAQRQAIAAAVAAI